jgi:ATP-binding cassette subfamily B (MDR/TAP) protein 1
MTASDADPEIALEEKSASPAAAAEEPVKDAVVAKDGDDKEVEKEKVEKVSFSALFRYATRGDMGFFFLAWLGATGRGIAMPMFAVIFGDAIDGLNASNAVEAFTPIALAFLYLGAGLGVAAGVQTACTRRASAKMLQRVRTLFVRRILRQDQAYFDIQGSQELHSRLGSDVLLIGEAIGDKFSMMLMSLAQTIGGFFVGFFYSWQLTLVLLAAAPVLGACGAMMMIMLQSLTGTGQGAYAKAGSIAVETLHAVRTVWSFGLEGRQKKDYGVRVDEATRSGIKTEVTGGAGLGFMNFSFYGAYALGLWYGAVQVADGNITPGEVLTVFFAVLFGIFGMGTAAPSFIALGKARAAAAVVYGIIERVPTIDPEDTTGKPVNPKEVKGSLSLKDVRFSYPTRPNEVVLDGLSLEVEAGTSVALVGPSGCGKSSILKMLLRHYDPASGSISLDGTPIPDLVLNDYRSAISIVEQEPRLFDMTIRDNIRFGRPSATDEEVEAAAKTANAHKFIRKLPDGYSTTCGPRGTQLSGGQKQRIAIARAVLMAPPILLLDEATSALDTKSERVVQKALDAASKGRTTVIVAHRLSTIRKCDCIFVMDAGKVVEKGTWKELVAADGVFASMVATQKLAGAGDEDRPLKESSDPREEDDLSLSASIEIARKQSAASSTGIADATAKADKEDDEVQLDDDEAVSKSAARSYSWRFIRPEFGYIVLGSLAALVNGGHQPVVAIILTKQINTFFFPVPDLIVEESVSFVKWWMIIGGAALLSSILQFFFFGIASQRAIGRVRKAAMAALIRQEAAWHDEARHSPPKLAVRLSRDAELMGQLYGSWMSIMIQALATLASGIAISFYYDWRLALVVLASLPLMGAGSAADMATFMGAGDDSSTSALRYAAELLDARSLVSAFGATDRVVATYDEMLTGSTNTAVKSSRKSGIISFFGQLGMYGSMGGVYMYGAYLIDSGKGVTFETVFTAQMAMFLAAMQVAQSLATAPSLGKIIPAARAMAFLTDRESAIDPDRTVPGADSTPPAPSKGVPDVEFDNVHFHYPTRPEAKILRGISFTAERGQTVALVGESGSGKSTCIQLVERFYDAVDGSVKVYGVDVRKHPSTATLRANMGLVAQEPTLFTGTVIDNVCRGIEGLAGEKLSDKDLRARVEAACRDANAHEFISELADGYDTDLGESGTSLSGGQKQRIAIARAIMRGDDIILLLDEATSALDSKSEGVVQAALDKASETRTTLVIAHRLKTIENADKIIVFDSGVVVEQGTYTELLEKDGKFAAMVRAQS